MMNYYIYEIELYKILIASDENIITCVKCIETFDGVKKASALTDKAAKQLDEYFTGKRRIFDLPLNPQGTEFQKAVWNALLTVPYGETASYKQIAERIGNPKACRAVGIANNKNPIWIIIPCHRIIGAGGQLVGYGGGLEMKEKLLKLEKSLL